MKSRGLVVAIAVVLAVLAAVGVIVYTSNVRQTAVDENTTPVLASTQDIQANTALDPLIAQGVFQTIQVSNSGVVPNAVTDVAQLQGQTATRRSIRTSRFHSTGSRPAAVEHLRHRSRQHRTRARGTGSSGGQRLRPARRLRHDLRDIRAGHASSCRRTRGSCLRRRSSTAVGDRWRAGSGRRRARSSVPKRLHDSPRALRLRYLSRSRTRPWTNSRSGDPHRARRSYILNMTPEDAQELVFATGHSTLYLGLLPPDNQQGYPQAGTIGVPSGRSSEQ